MTTLRILQVSAVDRRGGAALVAWGLHREYRRQGHEAWLAVGEKLSEDPWVCRIPNWESHPLPVRALRALAGRLEATNLPFAPVATGALQRIAQPIRTWKLARGYEDFHYPGTWKLLEMTTPPPQIIHGHNLHGGYFDLRALPWLSQRMPVVLTLHDAWLLSGHCAHSFDCDRWKMGCGQCPDLTIYPAIPRDATAANWRRKQKIFARTRLFVATPCAWLLQKVQQSMLAPAIVESKIIPNGVDLDVFQPVDPSKARSILRLPHDACILLFTADGILGSPWKDYPTMRAALKILADRLQGLPIRLLALGESAPPERLGSALIHFVPFQDNPKQVAVHYQAADVYVHAARADTYPNTVLEALATGTPVVATSVGGIPEQVRSLPSESTSVQDAHEATGILVPPHDAAQLATALERLVRDVPLRRRLRDNAIQQRERWDVRRQAKAYLEWYAQILEQNSPPATRSFPA